MNVANVLQIVTVIYMKAQRIHLKKKKKSNILNHCLAQHVME